MALAALALVGGVAACSSDGGSDGATATTAKDGGAATTTTAADDASTTTDPAGSTTVAPDARSGEFSLLSYNVAGLPQEISKEHPGVNLPKISPLLNAYDVVITQEDFDWWPDGGLASTVDFVHYHERLRADATHQFRSDRHPGPDATDLSAERKAELEIGDGLGVLSRYAIDGNTRVPWTNCFGGFDTSDHGAADCLSMKGFLLTRLTLANGVVVDLYDLHGEAGGSDSDQALQADDFEQLAAYVNANSKGHAVILGGDTNLHTDEPGPDAHEDSGNGKDLEIWTTFLKATGLTDSCTAVTCDDEGRIDKIAFRSGEGVDLKVVSHEFQAERFTDEAGNALSDHDPLEVRFSWTATS